MNLIAANGRYVCAVTFMGYNKIPVIELLLLVFNIYYHYFVVIFCCLLATLQFLIFSNVEI